MSKQLRTKKQFYLLHALLYIAFAILHLFEDDYFLGSLLFFSAMINLVAFRQIPWRIAPITVLLNLFNASVALSLTYSYWVLQINEFTALWAIIGLSYFIAAFRQIYCIIMQRLKKKKR